MEALLFTYLRTGFFASVMILAVLLLRPLLRKASRNISCVLWLLVILRLLLPFQLESPLSLQPQLSESATVTDWVENLPASEYEPVTDLSPSVPSDPIQSEAPPAETRMEPETVITILWGCGMLAVLLYVCISYGVLRYRIRDAVKCPEGVWESDRIGGAFLLGYCKPKIYIPAELNLKDRRFILAHEQSHLKRGDHWWKLLGMLCLSIHWYNPLVWLAYALLCRDIEVACDERVIRDLELEERKSYSFALLNCGKRLSGFLTYPVAFGEVSLKSRIKKVLNYRKPSLWITLSAFTVSAVIAVCFMTNPASANQCAHEFDSVITADATCLEMGVQTDTCKLCGYTCTATVPVTSHSYDAGVVSQSASCTAEGILTYTCKICNQTKTGSIPMLEHGFDEGVETQASTCSEKGILTCTCKTCGKTHAEAIDTLKHTFGDQTVTKAPTCVEEGEITVCCTLCGHQELVEKLPKSDNHDYKNKVIRKPTCQDPGQGEQVCSLCGHSVSCDYDLTDHTYGSAVVTKQATCTSKGNQTYTCTVCGDVQSETIPKKEHSWNEANCNTAATCTVCGKKGSVKGHDYVYTTDRSAVGRTLNEKTGTCTRCGATKYLYYSSRNTYDRAEVKNIGTSYAKKLGFITDPCSGHGSYSKITREPFVSVLELNGGQKMLEQMLISMIDELDSRCEDNSKYYAEIVVQYLNPYGIGDGSYFRLTVYSHLCTKGE